MNNSLTLKKIKGGAEKERDKKKITSQVCSKLHKDYLVISYSR